MYWVCGFLPQDPSTPFRHNTDYACIMVRLLRVNVLKIMGERRKLGCGVLKGNL